MKKKKEKKTHRLRYTALKNGDVVFFLLFSIVKIKKDEMTEKGRAFLIHWNGDTHARATALLVNDMVDSTILYIVWLFICFKFRAGHCDKNGLLSYWTGCKGKVLFIALFHLGGGAHQLHYCQALSYRVYRKTCVWWMAISSAASQGLAPLYVWTTTAFGLFLFFWACFWNSWAETTASGRNIKEDVYSLYVYTVLHGPTV